MKNLLSFIFCLTIYITAFGQTTIHSENFTGQNGKGAVGPGGSSPTIDLTGVTWSIDVSDLNLVNLSDWFQVQNEVFEARDVDGDAIWLSPSIDISAYSNVQFSLDALEDGDMESSDIFNTEYRINGGVWTIATTNGNLNENFTSVTVSTAGLSGNTLEIRVITSNGVGTEYHRLDNILVEGTLIAPNVNLNAATSTKVEGNTILIPVTMSSYSSGPVILNVNLGTANTGNNTYDAGDVTLSTTTLTFNGNGSDNISIILNQDIDADDEVIEITISEQTVTGVNIGIGVHTLTIKDDELPTVGDLVINEINYNPDGDDDTYEFIEIYNASGQNLNISGVTFTNGITYTFPNGTTIAAAEYIIIANMAATYSGNGYEVYEYSVGDLSNSGETITLEDGNSTIIDAVTYGVSSPWLTSPNGTGVTLSLFITKQNTADNDNANSWGASCAINGTPGGANVNCSVESEIVAVAASESATISSLENTTSPLSSSDGVQVWQFTINEGGSDLTDEDALPSIINSLVISQDPILSGIIPLSDVIKSAAIFDGTMYLGAAVIVSGSLTFSGSPLISISDGTSKTLSLRIS
ncbi:MAG: hypothetical protein ACJAUH_002872, partial [Saprospiraceae bacterium]